METTIVTEPVYRQVARRCRELLGSGEFRPGDRFPSERELAKRWVVSRATANKVISNLVAEGILHFRPGIGTFVSDQRATLQSSLRQMESFTEHARAMGMQPATKVLQFRRMKGGDLLGNVVDGLALASEDEVFYVKRLRLADGHAVILERRWLRAERVPGLRAEDLRGSLYGLLEEKYALLPGGERHMIRAANLTRADAALLGVRSRDAGLVVEGTGFDPEGEPLWFQVLLYRGDRYELLNELGGQSGLATTTLQFKKENP